MQLAIPKQYEALDIALNPDFALISNKGGLMMSMGKDSDVLQKTTTGAIKKEFKTLVGSIGNQFIGISNERIPEVYQISKLNGDQDSTFLSIERINIAVVVTLVSCGESHSIALDNNATAYTWGNNAYGQLGHGNFKDSDRPLEISYHMDVHMV